MTREQLDKVIQSYDEIPLIIITNDMGEETRLENVIMAELQGVNDVLEVNKPYPNESKAPAFFKIYQEPFDYVIELRQVKYAGQNKSE